MLPPLLPDDSELSLDPLLRYEIRRLKMPPYGESYRRFNRLSLAAMAFVVIGSGLLLIFSVSASPSHLRIYSGYNTIAWFLLTGYFAGWAVDVASLLFTLNAVQRLRAGGLLDLLRLTGISEQRIVASAFESGLFRVWRLLALVTNARLAIIALVGVFLLVGTAFAGALVALIISCAILSVYLVEPRWRVRALVAAGLAISAHVGQTTFAALAGLLVLLLLWTAQLGSLALLWLALSGGPRDERIMINIVCYFPLAYLALVAGAYRLYKIACKTMLASTVRRLARYDD